MAPPLSEAAIVDAAMGILRAEGLEAVSMRRVAAALGTGPASLYVHISGRDELLQAMLDRVAEAVPLRPPDPARWREQVHALMASLLSAFAAHPGIAAVAFAGPPATERTLLLADNLLGLLRAGGVGDRDAAWAIDLIPRIAAAAAGLLDQEPADADAGAAFLALPEEGFPHLAALSGWLASGGAEERLRFALDVFLDGLASRSA